MSDRTPSAATTESPPDISAALREIRSARERARGTADVIQGIPIYGSIWNTLFSIENALRAAERKLGRRTDMTAATALPRRRRSSEDVAREAVDAIRLALEGANNDRAAVAVIRTILADGPPVRRDDTGSVKRLLRAIKRTPKARPSQDAAEQARIERLRRKVEDLGG